ncbi:hypothetical protein [Thauera sp.]|uniref:hypothetical protein n=1 Tax=Thauera sp. TaxID=1905334 RepID=UPI0039E6DB5A
MKQLPPRLIGFFDALSAISDGAYQEGGFSIKYPVSFDRNNLEVIWICGGVERSEGFFQPAGLKDIATFFDKTILAPSAPSAESRVKLAEEFLSIVRSEMAADQLEIWYHDGGITAFLYTCINPGPNEHWIELFWSVD